MNDRDASHLEDMITYALDAIEMFGDADADALAGDKMRRYAVMRAVEVVGEAATRVSAEARASLPSVPWRAAVGMRNMLIRAYAGIDVKILADTVRRDFPSLVKVLREALGESAP
jgi:uncharacterized protein with HEPN domain